MTGVPKDLPADELLPAELLWAAGGHASDVALTALADGQTDILPVDVRAHVHGCTACAQHLGNAALLSLHTDRELATLGALTARGVDGAKVRGRLPRLAISLGLAVAALGLVPSFIDAPARLAEATSFVTHDAPLLMRGLGALARPALEPGSSMGLALTFGVAALVVGMAVAVVRRLNTKEVSS